MQKAPIVLRHGGQPRFLDGLSVRAAPPNVVWELWEGERPQPAGMMAAQILDQNEIAVAVAVAVPLLPHVVELSFKALEDLREYVPHIYYAAALLVELIPPCPRVQAYAYSVPDRQFLERLCFVNEGRLKNARRVPEGGYEDAWMMRLERVE